MKSYNQKKYWNARILLLLFCLVLPKITLAQNTPSNDELLMFKYTFEGNPHKVDSLLDLGANPNAVYFKQIPILAYAASKGETEILNALVNKGANLELVGAQAILKATPLGFAVLGSCHNCIHTLLSHGASTHGEASHTHPSSTGFTFSFTAPNSPQDDPVSQTMSGAYNWLMHAIKSKDTVSALALIEAGAPLDDIASFQMNFKYQGKTPLIYAAETDFLAMVKLLLDKGADVNGMGKDWENKNYNSPLMAATEQGHESIVSELIARHASIDLTDAKSMTALLYGAKQNQIPTSKLLIDNGADINHLNSDALNALQISMQLPRVGASYAINERAAATDAGFQYAALIANSRGEWTVSDSTGTLTSVDIQQLDEDIKRIQFPEIAKLMIEDETDIILNYKYQNLLYTKFMIENGINIHHQFQNNSAAKMAQQYRLDEALGVLLDAGVSTSDLPASSLLQHAIKSNRTDRFKAYYSHSTPLSDSLKSELLGSAVVMANNDIIDFLLDHDTDINATNAFHQTALHTAAYTGNKEMVEKLLALNADKTLADTKGVLPLMVAKFMNHKNIVPILSFEGLSGVAPINIGYSLAHIEQNYYQVKNPVLSGKIKFYQPYLYSNAIEKGISIQDPMLSWLYQNIEDSLKLKYASALLSQSFLEIKEGGNALETFKVNQAYPSWGGLQFSLSGNYQTGGNSRVNFTTEGTHKFTKEEDKDDTHDRSSSVAFHLQEFKSEWIFGTEYFAGIGVFTGACGGWDNHCVLVVDGDCYSFSEADPRKADISYTINGSYKIPGVRTVQGAFAAYPKVEIWNREKSIPLKVKQGNNTFSIDADERRTFSRQLGEIELVPSWSGSISASGGKCNEDTKQSAFQVRYPYTNDIQLRFKGTKFNDRLKNYADIYLLKRTLQESADTLSSIDLYGLNSTVLLKSKIARNTYKDVVRAELAGLVDFLENTNFSNINDALVVLAQNETLSLPDIKFRVRQLLNSGLDDQTLIHSLEDIEQELDQVSLNEVRNKILAYKDSYYKVLQKKITRYNLLLLEYVMYIPNEALMNQLAMDRIPILERHLNEFSRHRFNL